MVKVLNKNVLLQAEVRDFKHSRGPPVRHMVSQFKGTEDDDDYKYNLNPKVRCQQANQWGFVRVYLDLATHVVEPA